MDQENKNKWWKHYKINSPVTHEWKIGPFTLWLKAENQIAHWGFDRKNDPLDNEFLKSISEKDISTFKNNFRTNWISNEIKFIPQSPDRAIIAHFRTPHKLLPREKIILFISSPLWLKLEMNNSYILDEALYMPSDTWFGSSMNGELAYATKVNCQFSLKDMPIRPHRVISMIEIENTTSELVTLHHLKLPIQFLNIYEASNDLLFTEKVIYKLQNREPKISVKFSENIGLDFNKLVKVGSARKKFDHKFFKKTFEYFFKLGDFHGVGSNEEYN